MKNTLVLLYAIVVSCSAKNNINSKLPYPIEEIYFQKWIGGREETGGGTNFYIKFKEPFSANFVLKKVYFRGKEANFNRREESIYYAYFNERPKNPDLINQDDSNTLTKPKYDLKDNEAILEFEQDSTIGLYKISNITEKELLAYPSARPRN